MRAGEGVARIVITAAAVSSRAPFLATKPAA